MSKHLGDKLIDDAWDTLTPGERKGVDDHLRDCADCRIELARHRSLVGRVAATIPAMLPPAPARLSANWPAIAARIAHLHPSPSVRRRGSPGLVAVGLAISTAALLIVTVTVQAWLGHGWTPITATAFCTSSTPIASATYTPEHPPIFVTPMSRLPWDEGGALPMQAPLPLPVVTARP